MAVQQNKKSPSKRGMHRAHYALDTPGTAIEPTTGEQHLRHHSALSPGLRACAGPGVCAFVSPLGGLT